MATRSLLKSVRKNKRAVSPAISTAIITCAIVVMLLVTMLFANNYLNTRLAANEFNAMQQSMETVGLQVDDVAWIPGRTQTMHYASKFGSVRAPNPALTYSFTNGTLALNFSVGIIMFDIPTSVYSIINGYFAQIFPPSNSFLQQNASAPTCRVFAVEKQPMVDGSFTRIVVAPIIRQMSSIVNNVTYLKLYLPILENAPSPLLSQSITLTGRSVSYQTMNCTNNLTINLSFPNAVGMGLTSDFFNFDSTSKTITISPNTVVEIYTGKVAVSLGAYA